MRLACSTLEYAEITSGVSGGADVAACQAASAPAHEPVTRAMAGYSTDPRCAPGYTPRIQGP